MTNLTSLIGWNSEMIYDLIKNSLKLKKNPEKYYGILRNKSLLLIFEKPSLRTRISFQVGMHQLGGYTVVMETRDTPLGGKESLSDTAKASSRYCDIIAARLFKQEDMEELAKNTTVPVINALTDTFHPCQILSDIFTIYEKKKKIKGVKLCFVGDGNNNITHDLLLGCSGTGMDISVGCPKEMEPQKWIIDIAKKKAKKNSSRVEILNDARKAVKNADIVYADTWMSYHIPKEEKQKRIKIFQPYQVNRKLMSYAKKDAIFMNCLPAMRGYEQTAEVIDGPQSVVFDQAENRLHVQKGIMLKLLNKKI